MRLLFFSLVQFILTLNAFAQFPHPDSSYFFLFGNTNTEEFRDGCNHSIDSGYVMIGTSSSFSGDGSDLYLVKTDRKGKTLWSRTIGGTGMENGYSIAETPDHGFIIGGITNSNASHDYNMLLVKTDYQGIVQWQKEYGGSDWDFLNSVCVAQDSGFILGGQTYSFGNLTSQLYLIRTNKHGDTLWTKAFGGPNQDAINKVITTQDSAIVAVGYSENTINGMKDLFLIKCKFTTGDSIFTRTYSGPYNEEARDVVEHTALDSGYVLVGYTESFTTAHDKDLLLLKYSKNGSLMWQDHFGNNGGNDEATCICTQGQDFFVSGYTANGAGVCDLAAGVVDLFGNWQWNQSTSYGSYEADVAWSNFKTLTDEFVFVGSTQSFGSIDQDAMIILVDTIKFQFQKVVKSSDSLVSMKEHGLNPINVFPNPANNKINLSFKKPIQETSILEIIDVHGSLITRITLHKGEYSHSINLAEFDQGIYDLSVRNNSSISRLKLCVLH